ncbi:ComE operon protein 1 [Nocardioides dokdonensis FR1436]|uniref:ComE operon protein 1 n=1 Tax=Nocardioides dokdonensis FR1436 TaxID=1300347 RepID=A0A1A9GPK7_9ACTN|nr:ComEA family DNA-binding protein [Nocardioides dokdonensis]ANH40229.1 ComE operon protein 1 [Nocardioides dokdonensis FR1436]
MRSRRPSPEHQEAVTRRLAQLSAELDAVRPGPPAPLEKPPAPPPDRMPVPGRHAARRRRDRPAPFGVVDDLVPATLRGRALLGSAHLGVIALLVAAGLAVTSWWVVRSDPEPVPGPRLETVAELDTPLVDLVPPATAAPPGPATASAAPEGQVTIDVAGKVRRPGIAVLPAGSRVHDALEAAGGARPGVDLAGLNLARVLVDGEQVLVGLPGGSAPVAPGVAAPAPGTPGAALVDLNTADQTLLETLPQVGPVTAAAILAWRTEHGAFTAVEELLEVDGIGEATLAQLAPLVTV